jgi:hypothetical protein
MTYSFSKEGDVFPIGNKLELTIIAINKKYVLAKFTDNVLEYRYATTEFPFGMPSYQIKVMGSDSGEYEPMSDYMPASQFANYCIERDEALDKLRKPYRPFSAMYSDGKGTAFRSMTVIYGLDKEDNLYRLELKSGINESLRKAQKKFVSGVPCYNLSTIKFGDEAKVGPAGDYYELELVVGPEHSQADKVKYIGLSNDFLTAIEARRAYFENQREAQLEPKADQSDHPFKSGPVATQIPMKTTGITGDTSNIDGIL